MRALRRTLVPITALVLVACVDLYEPGAMGCFEAAAHLYECCGRQVLDCGWCNPGFSECGEWVPPPDMTGTSKDMSGETRPDMAGGTLEEYRWIVGLSCDEIHRKRLCKRPEPD